MRVTMIGVDDTLWSTGIRSVSAALREAGHETVMVFAGEPKAPITDSLVSQIARLAEDSQIIAVSSMSRASSRAKALIEGLHPLGKLIVWGGTHPTLYPEECTHYADVVCRGEGEGFMLDLVECVALGRDFADIQNAAYVREGELVLNDLRPLLTELDELPLPTFDFEEEWVLDISGELLPNSRMHGNEMLLFSGSRGCQNSCTYCANSKLKAMYRGQAYARKMSVAAFVEGAKRMREVFPTAREAFYCDEDFFDRPVEEMRELAELLSEQVGVPFRCMAYPRNVTEERMSLATQAGMWQIAIGLESGCERTRKQVFNRHVDNATQMQAAKIIQAHPQVNAVFYLIIGNPYEGREDLLEGVRLLSELPHHFSLSVYNLVLLPGTKLFDKAVEDGIIGGAEDSACDLDYLAGFDYEKHDWKRHELYLNSLISLMSGRFTTRWMGSVPRALVPFLTRPHVIAFCERHTWTSDALVGLAKLRLRVRGGALLRAAALVKGRRTDRNQEPAAEAAG